jgi:hypothetical protein
MPKKTTDKKQSKRMNIGIENAQKQQPHEWILDFRMQKLKMMKQD